VYPCSVPGWSWGRLEVEKFGAHVCCLGMAQTTLTWLGTTCGPPHSVHHWWEPPEPARPWGSVDFKGTWKRKAHSLCQQTPPAPTMPSASSSLPSPGNRRLPFSQKSYPTSPHPCALLGFFHLEHKNQDPQITDCIRIISIQIYFVNLPIILIIWVS
jgi:hypothetical protein